MPQLWWALADVALDENSPKEFDIFYCFDCVPPGTITNYPRFSDEMVGDVIECFACGKVHEIKRELGSYGERLQVEVRSRLAGNQAGD